MECVCCATVSTLGRRRAARCADPDGSAEIEQESVRMNRPEFARRCLFAMAVAALTVTGCAPVPTVPTPGTLQFVDSGAFVTTLGNDTLAIERFVIRGNTL